MLRTIKGRYGPITYLGKDEYVGKSIHNYGEYNPDETEFIVSLATPGKLCLDIGANFGVMGQALEHAGHEVISFEPQPELFKLVLSKNVQGIKYNVALGEAPGVGKMPKLRYDERNNFGGMGVGFRSVLGTIDVEIRTLDSFGFDNVGLMKIDVEGFEEKVLRGGVETILRNKPIMYIEDDRMELSRSLREFIVSLGYSIEEHKPALYRENNFFGYKKNVWDKNYVSHNLIARPI